MEEQERERIKASIVKEKDQFAVRIPTNISSKFSINNEKDMFEWIVVEDEFGISLQGRLLKNAKKKDN